MLSRSQQLLTAAALAGVIGLVPTRAGAAPISGFKGPWKPATGTSILVKDANGWENAVYKPASFAVTVSPDESTLVAEIANFATQESSFWIENYTSKLPAGFYSYDYKIKLSSPTGFVDEFDDFGNSLSSYVDGYELSGKTSGFYPPASLPYPYFGFFGVNITDYAGTAKATITLTNFSFTPVPGPLPLAGALVAFRASRSLRRRQLMTALS